LGIRGLGAACKRSPETEGCVPDAAAEDADRPTRAEVHMSDERDYWIETVSKTYLYYRVKAKSKREALQKYQSGVEGYVGCNDSPDQGVVEILTERPHVSWR